MNEATKFIISGLNKLLGRNYNFISFNALDSENLIQILSDVLADVQNEKESKIDTSLENPEERSIRMFNSLRVLKYLPEVDPVTFRQGLVVGNPDIINAALEWILSNMEIARQRAYLAHFLVMVQVPPEYLSDADISNLYNQYASLVEEFKLVHKEYETGKKVGEKAAELKADVVAMEKEKEIILGRVEKMKMKTESGMHLLEVCRLARKERDKERDLMTQKKQEIEALDNLQVSLQRLEGELETLRKSENNLTPELVIQRLSEEITVQTAFLKERLPAELSTKNDYVKALKLVSETPYIGTDEISSLRNKLDSIAREVQTFVEKKTAQVGTDKMAPFRQQASSVSTMKRNALDQLEKAENELIELETRLADKKKDAEILLEQPLLSDEEFKQYVARLKAKGVIYKRCREEISGIKAENGVLSRTVEILNYQINQLQSNFESQTASEIPIPSNFTMDSGGAINKELYQSVKFLQTQLTTLLNDLKLKRKALEELEDKYKKISRSNKNKNETTNLIQEIEKLKRNIKENDEKTKKAREKISGLKEMEQLITKDSKQVTLGYKGIVDEIKEGIEKEEKKLKTYKEEEKKASEIMSIAEFQSQQWQALKNIFECKLKCAEDNKKQDGIVVRGGGTETLILQ